MSTAIQDVPGSFGDSSDAIISYLNALAIKTKEAFRTGNIILLKQSLASYLYLWEVLDGMPFIIVILVNVSTLCYIIQLELVLCMKGYLNLAAQQGLVLYERLLAKLCRIFRCCGSDLVEKLNILMVLMRQSQPVLRLMLMKLSWLAVLLKSLSDSCFDGNSIMKVLSSSLGPSSSGDDDLWHMVLEVKHFLECDNIKLESLYYKAWRSFVAGQSAEALSTLTNGTCLEFSTNYSKDSISLLKGNSYFLLDKPDQALAKYNECTLIACPEIMKQSISNSCYLLRKYNYSGELDLRMNLLKLFPVPNSSPMIILYSGGVFSSSCSIDSEVTRSALLTVLCALQLKEFDVAISLLSGVLEKEDGHPQPLSMWYLLLMKALLANKDYSKCWKLLCRLTKYLNAETSKRKDFMVLGFQICYFGCYISLHLHKLKLAEIFGHRCIRIGAALVADSEQQITWITQVQIWCTILISIIYVWKNQLPKALSWLCHTNSLFASRSSLLTAYTYCLVAMKGNALKDCSHLYDYIQSVLHKDTTSDTLHTHINRIAKVLKC